MLNHFYKLLNRFEEHVFKFLILGKFGKELIYVQVTFYYESKRL